VTPFDKLLYATLGSWCVYNLVQALRCVYYVLFEPWVLEEDEDEEPRA